MNRVQRINLDCKIVTEEDMMSHTYLFNAGVKYIETPTNVTSFTLHVSTHPFLSSILL